MVDFGDKCRIKLEDCVCVCVELADAVRRFQWSSCYEREIHVRAVSIWFCGYWNAFRETRDNGEVWSRVFPGNVISFVFTRFTLMPKEFTWVRRGRGVGGGVGVL
jgi:hypothetical protein